MFISEISSRQHHLLQGDVKELQDRLENIEGRIESLLTSLNIMGSSITEFYISSSTKYMIQNDIFFTKSSTTRRSQRISRYYQPNTITLSSTTGSQTVGNLTFASKKSKEKTCQDILSI